jgi:hypothetical protein
MTRAHTTSPIDRGKLRAHARRLDPLDQLIWLDRAIDLLPDEALTELIADYVRPEDLAPEPGRKPDMLREIRQFHRDSLAGRYYQDFMVDSRNFEMMSSGTATWIAEHTRLLEGCLQAERTGDLEKARQGIKLLLELLREIDRCETEIIFFADEGGSWQVGVNWSRVLPAWFRSLAPVSEAYDYAEAVVDAINHFAWSEADAILAAAREIGSPEQNAALDDYECNIHRRR